jgi:hypothetical protein
MRAPIKPYVSAVAAAAVLLAGAVYWHAPGISQEMWQDALVLCGLAITAELLAVFLPQSATGSIGFIPYFAAAVVVPGWPSVLSVLVVKATAEVWSRKAPIKAVLNIAQHGVMESVVILLYVALGGVSLRSIVGSHDLAHVTRVAAAPALVSFLVGCVVANMIVTVAIGLSSGRSVSSVLRVNHNRSNVGLDFLSIPLIFVFAWIFVQYGAIAAATLWVPIMGLRQLQRNNVELEQTNEELLELMVKSIEARDPYTSGHSRRVQNFSMTIARAIGLKDRQVEEIGRAALLHDVGKIYEKYAKVLAKQDKLSAEEWAIIQDHPVDGANLVATMTRLRGLVPPVRHHHENWDGTGYPDRIAGNAIPRAARIIRFADTIDAMTTERPYRRPLTEAQVRSEVVRCRGTQFDPDMTDRLLSSPLWATLFAPDSNEVTIAPLVVIPGSDGHRSTRALPFRTKKQA